MQNPNPPTIPFEHSTAISGVQIIIHQRKIHMHTLTDPELNSLQESGLSATVDLALFALSVGILVSAVITLSTVDISNPKIYATYVAASIVTGLLSLWFGIRAFIGIKNARTKLKEIKGSN